MIPGSLFCCCCKLWSPSWWWFLCCCCCNLPLSLKENRPSFLDIMVMPRWCHLCSECMNSESFGGEGGGLAVHYSIHAFPLAIHTWGALSSQASSTKEMKIAPVSLPLLISLSVCFSSNCSDSAYSRSTCKSAIIPRECPEHKNPNFHSFFFFFLFQEGTMQSREANQNCRTTTRGVCLWRPSWSSFQNMCTKRERKRKSAKQNPGTKEESSWTY